MSLINSYKLTVHGILKGSQKRILITTQFGFNLIKNVFSQKEMLDMEILGSFLIDDPSLYVSEIFDHEIIYFIENGNENYVMKAYSKFKNNVYIHFYTPIEKYIINDIMSCDSNNLICDISYSWLGFIPISDHSAVGDKINILSLLKNRPDKIITEEDIFYHPIKYFDNFISGLHFKEKNKLYIEKYALFEHILDDTLLITLERSFDKITPLLIPWRYESMLHFHKVKIQNHNGHCDDQFFIENRYKTYVTVLKNISVIQTSSEVYQEASKYESKNKIIMKHIHTLNQLKMYIEQNKIMLKSELEQKAITETISNEEKVELKKVNEVLYELLYSSNIILDNFGFNLENIFNQSFNESLPIYFQHVPKIRSIIQNVTKNNYSTVFIYVKDYICYEEVAEIELFNESNNGKIKIYLLSDSILDQWNYLATMHPDNYNNYNSYNSCNNYDINTMFRIYRPINLNHKKKTVITTNYDNIEDKLIFLEKNHITFDEEKEKKCKLMDKELSILLMKEYDILKQINPKNKLEENDKNIKLIRLNKLSIRYKKIENRSNNIFEKVKPLRFAKNPYINYPEHDDINDGQLLLQQHNKMINERGEVIKEICKSITDVNSMMLELRILVETQGLKLDEIDMNIIKASELTQQGVKELEKTDEYQNNGTSITKYAINTLIGLITVFGIALGVKIGF